MMMAAAPKTKGGKKLRSRLAGKIPSFGKKKKKTKTATIEAWREVDLDREPRLTYGATPLVARCMREENWTESFAMRVLNSYIQWLTLLKLGADKEEEEQWGAAPPPPPVEMMWRQHILDGTNYCDDSLLLCGRVVHHNPDADLLPPPETEEEEREEAMQRERRTQHTQQLLLRTFAADELDVEIWKDILLSSIMPKKKKNTSCGSKKTKKKQQKKKKAKKQKGDGEENGKENSGNGGKQPHQQQQQQQQHQQPDRYIQIFVKPPAGSAIGGKHMTICVSTEYTVSELKRMVEERTKGEITANSKYRFKFNGRYLDDTKALSYYGIDCENTLQCCARNSSGKKTFV